MNTLAALTAHLQKRGFVVKDQEEGAYALIHPSRGKFEWESDELGYRSMILDRNAAVVSAGWPKFFNQGEWPDHDTAIAAELADGRAVITHKHDGSLIIRSVLPDGRVVFRTRDTFDGGKFAPLAEAVAQAKYPALLDPTVLAGGSLLFEYVGAGNQIVVRYAGDDDLILLGYAEHVEQTVRYAPYADVVCLAEAHGLRAVETYDWADARNGVREVLGLVQGWDTAEGVVIRSGDGQTMLKVKSAWYFAQHALRWHVKLSSIARFCIDGGIEDEPSFLKKLTEVGWDYETAQVALGYFHEYQARRAEVARIKATALEFVAAFEKEIGASLTGERARRKAFAGRVFGADTDSAVRALSPSLFYAYDGKVDHLEAKLLQKLLLNGA